MSDLRMPDLNKVFLSGRLTRDPELRYLSSGTPLCKMGLAVSRNYKTKEGDRREETLFVDVTAWRGTAEFCGEKLKKGRPILVEGRLKSDEWEDKNTGQKRTKIEIQADRVQQLDWDSPSGSQSRPEPRPIEEPVPEDDIPF
jgi:single-strand DNA-binding protein